MSSMFSFSPTVVRMSEIWRLVAGLSSASTSPPATSSRGQRPKIALQPIARFELRRQRIRPKPRCYSCSTTRRWICSKLMSEHQTCRESNARAEMRMRGRRSKANAHPRHISTAIINRLGVRVGALQGGDLLLAQANLDVETGRICQIREGPTMGAFVLENLLKPGYFNTAHNFALPKRTVVNYFIISTRGRSPKAPVMPVQSSM